jgi:hypothetical protein
VTTENDHIEVSYGESSHKVRNEAEADELSKRLVNTARSKLKSIGWTSDEIDLSGDVEYGLYLVNIFCNRNIFAALAHRYAYIFYRFNLDKNEITRNILTVIIASEQKKQLSNLLIFEGGTERGFEREETDAFMNKIYTIMDDQIVDPIIDNLQGLFDIEKYEGPEAEEMENSKEVSHSLLFNRYISSDVKNIIGCFLKVLRHYTKENTTPLIEQFRTILSVDGEVISNRKRRLSSKDKLELEVRNEYDSMMVDWYRRDDEGDSDRYSRRGKIQSPSHQSYKYANNTDRNNRNNDVGSVSV